MTALRKYPPTFVSGWGLYFRVLDWMLSERRSSTPAGGAGGSSATFSSMLAVVTITMAGPAIPAL
jgi:hypothetical protein